MNVNPVQIITRVVMITMISIVLVAFVPFEKAKADDAKNLIPQWIKHDAAWWHEDKITEGEFIGVIRWSVENRMIALGYVMPEQGATILMPKEVKNIAYMWSQGTVSDHDFVGTIRYLVKNGIIVLDKDFESQVKKDVLRSVGVANDTEKSVVIVPVLTSSAYSEHGFYAYYRGECKACTTISLKDTTDAFTASANGLKILKSLGYQTVTDVDVDMNPRILEKYDTVVLLHNEYVTQKEFGAITGHPHVIYLYPNALYAQVSINYWNNTVILVRGHGYPDKTIRNGFDWKYDNSSLEYDLECKHWKFHQVNNGMMLNCYPDGILSYDMQLLKALKDF